MNPPSAPLKTYYPFWGKTSRDEQSVDPYHLLVYHCLDAAAVAGVILDKNPYLRERFTSLFPSGNEQIQNYIQFSVALHDLGKFSGRFQSLSRDTFSLLNPGKTGKPYLPGIRHDAMGTALITETLWETVREEEWFPFDYNEADEFDWLDVWEAWFQPISGHHGSPTKPLSGQKITISSLFSPEETEAALDFSYDCYRLFLDDSVNPLTYSDELLSSVKRGSWLLAGLTILSDWIASGDMFAHHAAEMPIEEYWKAYALPQAEKAVRAAGILPQTPTSPLGVQNLFGYDTPSPVQHLTETMPLPEGPLLMIIEDQTGSGKTEAAITATHRLLARGDADGFFFALPTTATANSMYERMESAYRRLYTEDAHPWLILSHGSRKLSPGFRRIVHIGPEGEKTRNQNDIGNNEYPPAECSAWIADNRKKSLLATVGVGTVDQALMAALPFRHQSLRLLGLATHVLIVDEVHSYDSYMNKILESLLRFQAALGGSVILLSATLPTQMRNDLARAYCEGLGRKQTLPLQSMKYPLITLCSENGAQEVSPERETERNLNYQITPLSEIQDVHSIILEKARSGKCVCWVRNTVTDAVESYQHIREYVDSDHVILFHARFIAADRERIENEVLSRFGKPFNEEKRKGMVVIATQVIEQSLDLDFDCLISDLAPIDAVIQRAGRMHRHAEFHLNDGIPELFVLTPDPEQVTDDWYKRMFSIGAYVYPHHGQLWLTAKTLCEKTNISLPSDARMLIESVYSPEAQESIPESLRNGEVEALGKDFGDISIALNNALPVFSGYSWKMNWMDEIVTPTRLGEPVRSYILVLWDGSSVTPLAGNNSGDWEKSTISVSVRNIATVPECDGELAASIEHFRASLPQQAKWYEILPFIQDNAVLKAKVYDHRQNCIEVWYSHETGITFCK
ncbi:CRISPR-associated helicase Cas3' [Methanogenium sp. S4BF]|uniref:CRISPR-associated helicase Cas3' n=1 Tax=Methanogenium sp. S4BF TaxID=1789226 RepID=UPI0024174DDD|nr:CRISPR-associated helicase Cas3' [Methanogenium sp. S4BF]WFN33432.1 CRISPR-associated helicase Cas3' [Methanogenium sp. S4BF]